MFSKGGTGKTKAGRQQLSKELAAGAFVGMMAVTAPVGAQSGAGHGGNGREQGQGNGLVSVLNPVGPMQPSPRMDEDRQKRVRPASGDRRLSPEEKWQLRQLLKTAQ